MGKLVKLDTYSYMILPGVIRIKIQGTSDPILVDILSEIEETDGRIYVEGDYYLYLDSYEICGHGDNAYMDLEVVELNRS